MLDDQTASKIRLSAHDLAAIRKLFTQHFLDSDQLWIFGSRADLTKKGGDIDLYIETKAKEASEAGKMRMKFAIALEDEIGEQKIDIILNLLNFPYDLPIYEIAKQTGIRIV